MVSEISNICLQSIEALIAFFFYESISQNSMRKLKNFSIIFISYLFMCFVNLLFNYNVVVNTIVILICHFTLSFFIYKLNIKSSIFYPILFTCSVAISEISIIYLVSIVSNTSFGDYKDDIFQYLILIVFSKSILFFVIKLICDIINKNKTNSKILISYIVYPISLLLVLTVFNIISFQYDFTNKTKITLAITSLVMLLSVIITCIFQQQNSQKEQELFELKEIKQKQETDNTYFGLLEHQNEELQIFVHDMQKHFENIYNLSSNSDKTREYISTISKDLSNINKVGKTSNQLLDLIIDKYDYISQMKNINFEKDIHSSDLSFIKNNDLTSIFNNLLDNAIEAAEKSSEKKVILSINSFETILTISLDNSCDKPPTLKHNKLVSTKQDHAMHGYGFKSINKSVKKYNGDLEWEYTYTEHMFNVSIMFPLN